MLASLRKDGLGLQAEIPVLVLQIQEGREGGDAVANLYLHLLILGVQDRTGMTGCDAEDIHASPQQYVGVRMEGEAQVAFRRIGILQVVGRGSLGTGRCVLHLPEGGSRQGEVFAQLSVHLDLRSTAEGVEGSA